MNADNFLEFFSCYVCRCEFLKQPEFFDFEENFLSLNCASCGREVTKKELLALFDNREFKPPRRLNTSMFK